MIYCSGCGTQLKDDAKFCPQCGAAPKQGTAEQQAQSEGVSSNDKTMAVLSYFFFFLPLIAAPESRFARYHANQGLILLLTYIAMGIVNSVLYRILGWRLWALVGLVFALGYLFVTALGIIGIINAAQNREKPMPLIGSLFTIIK